MDTNEIPLTIVSDFNASVLARLLTHGEAEPSIQAQPASFGQVFQALSDEEDDPERTLVVWTRPEGILPSFAAGLGFEPLAWEALRADVDAFAELLLHRAAKVKHLFAVTWSMPPGDHGYGMLDWKPGVGLRQFLARANVRLSERLETAFNVHLLDADSWLLAGGPRAASPRMAYATKTPFGNAVFEAAATQIRAGIDGLRGDSRRLVLVDLDDTLWGGVIGETGWEGIRLGGHDHIGEAFQDFQRALKGLTRRGIQVGLVSKNTEEVALAAFDNHPEMVLRRSDLAGWRINWMDKAKNVAELVQQLNLGLKSVVFIDDNPAERGRVREALPEVLVPEWPEHPTEYAAALRAMACFDIPALSGEDRKRAEMYATERKRQEAHTEVGSHEDWLASLEMKLTLSALTPVNLTRVAQLFNKTNQMNMATRRLSEGEISAWGEEPGRLLLAASVADRFGESGLTGIVSARMEGRTAHLTDLILSCRVMGREVENVLVAQTLTWARAQGAEQLVASFRPTERNMPCLTFLRASGLHEGPEHTFTWDCAEAYPVPSHIDITDGDVA